MAKTNFQSVNEYIASHPKEVQKVLKDVRAALRSALPGADEVISYQIAAYKLRGATVIFFAGWKRHYSLYPAPPTLVAAFKKELAPYEIEKGTIRFPLSEAVPTKLIANLAKFRAKEIELKASSEGRPKRSSKAPAKKRATPKLVKKKAVSRAAK